MTLFAILHGICVKKLTALSRATANKKPSKIIVLAVISISKIDPTKELFFKQSFKILLKQH